jgi:hypothetical protein
MELCDVGKRGSSGETNQKSVFLDPVRNQVLTTQIEAAADAGPPGPSGIVTASIIYYMYCTISTNCLQGVTRDAREHYQ